MAIVVKELTEDKKSKFPEYVDKWVKIGLSTEECDVVSAVEWIGKSYEAVKLDKPKFIIGPVNSPYEGGLAEKILQEFVSNEIEFKDAKHLNELVLAEIDNRKRADKPESISISNQMYGCAEYWVSFYDFWKTEFPEIENIEIGEPSAQLAKYIGWWTPMKDIAILQHRPFEIHRDDQNRLHNTEGPAISYRDCKFSTIYRVHGVNVPKKVIDRDFNAHDIENEENVEVRRVMIDLYGEGRFLEETNAEVVNEDEFGTLFVKHLKDDPEPMYVVKVVNSTPEPDGSYKDYFIRVDPNMYGGLKTARAAIASTWRNEDGSLVFESPEDYDCSIET